MTEILLVAAVINWIKPLWIVAVGAGGVLAAIGALSILARLLAPKLAAVAGATTKETLSGPLFYVLLTIGVCALLIFPFIPYNTFGEDVKMVKDEGLTLIMVLAVILGVWTASVAIADEIEGRTALTVLSKPIARWHFIVGKFLGIVVPLAILFVVLGSLFLGTVSYKVKYDARETSNPQPTAAQCQREMVKVVPGLGLAFVEAVVLTSIGVAISTRLPMLPNLIICGAIYVLGHLVPVVTKSTAGQLEYVPFFANFLAVVLPVLEHFNIYDYIATGQTVSWQYVGLAAVYGGVFCTVALLVALMLFEDRDLA